MSAIAAGDLVIVLRGHCVHVMGGMPKTVLDVRSFPFSGHCLRCGQPVNYDGPCAEVQHDGFSGWLPLPWLKKIDPLADLESIPIADELDNERPRERVIA